MKDMISNSVTEALVKRKGGKEEKKEEVRVIDE